MPFSPRFSIKQKLIIMAMLISTISLLLASVAFVVYDIRSSKSEMIKELNALALIIGNNSTAAISFDDKESANEILSALKVKTHITTASLIINGKPMATYNRDKTPPSAVKLQAEGYHFENEKFVLFQNIIFNNSVIGAVYIESDLGELHGRLLNYFRVILIVVILILIVVFFLTSRLQRLISNPILKLAQITEDVSLHQNYSIQIEKSNDDEIGKLFDGFNQMMKQIRLRDTQLIEAQNKLELRVLERTEELRKTNENLADSEKELRKTLTRMQAAHEKLKEAQQQLSQSEKMASIGQLAAGVAHEINNPIGFISNNVDVLKEYVEHYSKILQIIENLKQSIDAGDQEKAKAIVEELKKFEQEINLEYIKSDITPLLEHSSKGLERIKKIVVDLRTFAREDKSENSEPLKIETVIDSILGIVQNELKYKATLIKEYGETPLIKCIPQRIGQVFINLLVNASQAINEKGEIKIRTYTQEKYVAVEISDTGKGISEEHLQKVFDPFFTTKPVGQGTGLGLSISYEIMKKHNGDIQVTSTSDKGTTFTVRLPL